MPRSSPAFSKARGVLCGQVLLALLAACTAEEPSPSVYDGKIPADLLRWLEVPAGCPAVPTLAAPLLSSHPSSTGFSFQAFRGTAQGAADVVAQGAKGNVAAKVDTKGGFCVEVPLVADTLNTIVFSALDARGCPGKAAMTTITHKTQVQADSGITTPVNLAQGKAPVGSDPKSGNLSDVTDGSSSTSTQFGFFDWGSTCSYIEVDLGRSFSISKFRLVWGNQAGSSYGREYSLLLSVSSAPSAPACSGTSTGWTLVLHETNGALQTTDITGFNPQSGRWAALLLFEDASASPWESFDLAEFEVWGQDSGATVPVQPERCN